mmetsp:Transcript_39676/g.94004  ORF Transcript_39676/g.94004 Transcript_39676/m.94004 type:complete len:629 (-) Transcript_39676:205-2091(-)
MDVVLHVLGELLKVHGLAVLQRVAHAIQLHAEPLVILDPLVARARGHHLDLEGEILAEVALLALEHRNELRGNLGGSSDHSDADHSTRQREGLVDRAERARSVLAVHDHSDLALRGALSDRAHVNARGSERSHEGTGHAGGEGHALADDGDDGHVAEERDRVDRGAGEFKFKGLLECSQCRRALVVGHGHADGVLGGGLGDHEDVDVARAHGLHEAASYARDTDDACALQIDHGHLVNGRDALDGDRLAPIPLRPRHMVRDRRVTVLEGRRAALDDSALEGGVEDVAHVHRDVVVDARHHRRGMQHLRAEVGQLHCLIVLERLDRESLRHTPRVRRVHAVGVLPHGDAAGAHELRKDGGRVVRPRALESRWDPRLRDRHEPRHDDNRRLLRVVQVVEPLGLASLAPPVDHALRGHIPQRRHSACGCRPFLSEPVERRLDDQHLASVHPRARDVLGLQVRVERLRRPDLSEPCDKLHVDGRDCADEAERAHDVEDVLAVTADVGLDRVCDLRGGKLLQRANLALDREFKRLFSLGHVDQSVVNDANEKIRHAAHGRHNRHRRDSAIAPSLGLLDQQIADGAVQPGICQGSTAELVNLPRVLVGFRHFQPGDGRRSLGSHHQRLVPLQSR